MALLGHRGLWRWNRAPLTTPRLDVDAGLPVATLHVVCGPELSLPKYLIRRRMSPVYVHTSSTRRLSGVPVSYPKLLVMFVWMVIMRTWSCRGRSLVPGYVLTGSSTVRTVDVYSVVDGCVSTTRRSLVYARSMAWSLHGGCSGTRVRLSLQNMIEYHERVCPQRGVVPASPSPSKTWLNTKNVFAFWYCVCVTRGPGLRVSWRSCGWGTIPDCGYRNVRLGRNRDQTPCGGVGFGFG